MMQNIEFEAELMKRLEKHYGADYEIQIRDVTNFPKSRSEDSQSKRRMKISHRQFTWIILPGWI